MPEPRGVVRPTLEDMVVGEGDVVGEMGGLV